MIEIIDWLKTIEKAAGDAYDKAAELFRDDEDFHDLLIELAADELAHYSVLARAADCLEGSDPPSILSFDDEAKERIMRPLEDCMAHIVKGDISKKELLEFIVRIEFSELNQMFLYALASLERKGKKAHARNIDEHKDRIEAYIGRHPEYRELLRKVRQLPELTKKILVVEDDVINRDLLQAVLAGEGDVTAAANGREGLDAVGSNDFSAIVSDISMPEMDGITFYEKAIEARPELKDRFIFFTSSIDPAHADFFRAHRLVYLRKPAPISDIRGAVREKLHQA